MQSLLWYVASLGLAASGWLAAIAIIACILLQIWAARFRGPGVSLFDSLLFPTLLFHPEDYTERGRIIRKRFLRAFVSMWICMLSVGVFIILQELSVRLM